MSIGNREFGIPRKYQYQIGIWYLCPKFLGIFFLVFYRYLDYGLVKIWFNIGIFPLKEIKIARIKIGLVFGFCGCHFIGIGLVSVCHFPESGISSSDLIHSPGLTANTVKLRPPPIASRWPLVLLKMLPLLSIRNRLGLSRLYWTLLVPGAATCQQRRELGHGPAGDGRSFTAD